MLCCDEASPTRRQVLESIRVFFLSSILTFQSAFCCSCTPQRFKTTYRGTLFEYVDACTKTARHIRTVLLAKTGLHLKN